MIPKQCLLCQATWILLYGRWISFSWRASSPECLSDSAPLVLKDPRWKVEALYLEWANWWTAFLSTSPTYWLRTYWCARKLITWQGKRVKVNYVENLVSMQKGSVCIEESDDRKSVASGKKGGSKRDLFSLGFTYDSLVPAVVRIFVGACDRTVPHQIRCPIFCVYDYCPHHSEPIACSYYCSMKWLNYRTRNRRGHKHLKAIL